MLKTLDEAATMSQCDQLLTAEEATAATRSLPLAVYGAKFDNHPLDRGNRFVPIADVVSCILICVH